VIAPDACERQAKQDGLETVVGSDKEVAIKQIEKIMFPGRGAEPDKAAELDQRLRKSEWWNQVSSEGPAAGRAAST
jgi:imidazoleglycerol phosphate synthase glutamine amidotransferase subunit HisH